MASDMTGLNMAKGKAPATSVYPSPADEINHTFHEPSSPVLKQLQVAISMQREMITLPPINSIIHQMPSPSSSPQLPVAHYRSPVDAHLTSPNKFNRTQDDQLFPDRPATSDEVARPQSLFESPVRSTQPVIISERDQQLFARSSQPSPADLPRPVPIEPVVQYEPVQQPRSQHRSVQSGSNALNSLKSGPSTRLSYAPGRKPKQTQTAYDIHMRRSISPSAPRYGRNDIWARQAADPDRYVEPMRQEWQQHFEAVRAILPQPVFPIATPPGVLADLERISPADAAIFAARHGIALGSRVQQEKRRADSGLEMPPPKRTRKVSGAKAPLKLSVSPREAPLDMPGKKFRRRSNDANKAKAPAEKVTRDYSIYNDYCPPISTLDSDQVNFPNIEWKATPQDVTNHEDCHLLHPKEIPIVSKLVLTPSDYIYIKRRFFANRLGYARKGQSFNINAAQLACKGADEHGITGIDVNKTSRLHKAFDKVGWLDEKHMQRFL
ncbi:hypothetical protein E4T52_11434 [Aureobasidium sp. EXF-3400]|nr:hypothetical protein E4T51_10442 [Aureobasidium sp. EXF-12344]KAI4773600.1 hypothetical protein E4T52_11434 [Aureobasidium sp. EXF-3400]